jgi:Na+/proline symporter
MWTDAFQMFIVFGGLMTLIIKATIEVGGITTVFEKASAKMCYNLH